MVEPQVEREESMLGIRVLYVHLQGYANVRITSRILTDQHSPRTHLVDVYNDTVVHATDLC